MGQQLKWRKPNGEYSRPPSLEADGALKICINPECRQVMLKETEHHNDFAFSKWPDVCPRCGKSQNAEVSADGPLTHESLAAQSRRSLH